MTTDTPRVSDEWLEMNRTGYGSISHAVSELIERRAKDATIAERDREVATVLAREAGTIERYDAKLDAAEARVRVLEEALRLVKAAAKAYREQAASHFSDADYERDGVLAQADVDLDAALTSQEDPRD